MLGVSHLTAVVALAIVTLAQGQRPPVGYDYANLDQQVNALFDAYPAEMGEQLPYNETGLERFEFAFPPDDRRHLSVSLSRPEMMYRARGVNFAGRFTVTAQTCGIRCWYLVALNLTPEIAEQIGVAPQIATSTFGFQFRPDSRLIILNPPSSLVEFGQGVVEEHYRPICVVLGEDGTSVVECAGVPQ